MSVLGRGCVVCGVSLDGRRRQARYCSPSCRRHANRVLGLLRGEPQPGYAYLDAYLPRRNRANAPRRGVEWRV